jgi:hypothetical protein
MSTQITLGRLIGFKDFFPNEIPETKEVYAKKLGKELLFNFSCHFLSYFKLNAVPSNDDLLKEWFTFNEFKYHQSPSYYAALEGYQRLLKEDPGQRFEILCIESFLKLFTWLSFQKDIPETEEKSDASSTLPLFKLFLLFNDEILVNYQIASDSVKEYEGDREIQRKLLAMSFPQHDFLNVDFAQLLVSQFYKAMKLLDFLENNAAYHKLYNIFLNEFDCASKEDYIKSLGPAVMPSFGNKKPGWTILNVPEGESFEKSCAFLDRLSVEPDDETLFEQNDYLKLRSNPIQKLAKGQYRIIFDLFLVKKIYNGLFFKLSEIDQKNKKENKLAGTKLLFEKDFPGTYRNEFSEGVLVYDVLNEIYNDKPVVKFTGNEFKDIGLEREPDYYIRRDNKIILFESKDFFIRGDIKLSYNFKKIEAELKNNRLEKAVKQLDKNIRRVMEKELVLDDKYSANDVKIYPVILVHDSLYSASALNYWVHYWLKDAIEIMKDEQAFAGFDFERVAPVTIMEIDTLILYINLFKDGKLDIMDLIENYHQYVRYGYADFKSREEIEKYAYQSAIPFSEFTRDYGHKTGVELDMTLLFDLFRKYNVQ